MIVKIPSIKENVAVVESFIENAGEKIKIKESVYGNVLVSVTEAVNNAIVHGNKEDKEKKVKIKLKEKVLELGGDSFVMDNRFSSGTSTQPIKSLEADAYKCN